jgi:hypothetical protein
MEVVAPDKLSRDLVGSHHGCLVADTLQGVEIEPFQTGNVVLVEANNEIDSCRINTVLLETMEFKRCFDRSQAETARPGVKCVLVAHPVASVAVSSGGKRQAVFDGFAHCLQEAAALV